MHVQFSDKKQKEPSNSTYVSYYKLPYIGNLSTEIKQKIIKHCRNYCKSTNIKIVFSPFKVGDLISVKASVPKYLRSFVVYRLHFLAATSVILVKQLATYQRGSKNT